MDSSDKFMLGVIGIISAGIYLVIFTFVMHDQNMDKNITELIKYGTPPAEAICAIRPSYSGCTSRIGVENE